MQFHLERRHFKVNWEFLPANFPSHSIIFVDPRAETVQGYTTKNPQQIFLTCSHSSVCNANLLIPLPIGLQGCWYVEWTPVCVSPRLLPHELSNLVCESECVRAEDADTNHLVADGGAAILHHIQGICFIATANVTWRRSQTHAAPVCSTVVWNVSW